MKKKKKKKKICYDNPFEKNKAFSKVSVSFILNQISFEDAPIFRVNVSIRF